MSVKISEFGKLEDGRTVTAYTIFNKAGASCTFLNYGGYIQSVTVPDKNGKLFVRMGILRTQVSLDDVILIGEDDSAAKAKAAGRPILFRKMTPASTITTADPTGSSAGSST